jgi:hypothetical protein
MNQFTQFLRGDLQMLEAAAMIQESRATGTRM